VTAVSLFKVVFWYWWALAAVFLVCEMLLPGVVFLFIAIGAAASGLLLLIAADVSLEIQLVVFAAVSVISAIGLRQYLRGLQPKTSTLNARGEALVGQTFVLDQPILGGRGRIKLGDGSWSVTGPDMAAGAKIRVAAVNGAELRVEPAP
jgi:membrane protein implicated in regulation of membrane protease activity